MATRLLWVMAVLGSFTLLLCVAQLGLMLWDLTARKRQERRRYLALMRSIGNGRADHRPIQQQPIIGPSEQHMERSFSDIH